MRTNEPIEGRQVDFYEFITCRFAQGETTTQVR